MEQEYIINGISSTHDYCVRIPFAKYDNIFEAERQAHRNVNNWNESCAKAIEMFGLPGGKYSCRMTKTAIEFWFLEQKDAVLFELTCG